MLQNHSRCRNGRGCGQHPPEADSPRAREGGTSSDQESVDDSEEDRRFFADFGGFDWEEMSVLSMYKENYDRPWAQRSVDSLGDEDEFPSRTEAWVASAAMPGQDEEEEYQDESHDRDPEEEERRKKGLPILLEEMRRRSSEEGWPLDEQMAALQPEDKKDILQIMREELWVVQKENDRQEEEQHGCDDVEEHGFEGEKTDID
jgi:hypothetical protein